jgi:GT2 family glycosyltransferase
VRNSLLPQSRLTTSPKVTEALDSLQIAVVIPTYRRPDMLLKCVASLLAGSRRPDEIVIVGRVGDCDTVETIAKINASLGSDVKIRSAWVSIPGHIPPVETGVRTASGDLVALLDDDVTVTPEWLSTITSHFSDPTIGVVGGRVLVPGARPPNIKGKPGCISWYGKIWGNLGSVGGTTAFELDTVMECNCVWRRGLLGSLEFNPVLNFDDASMYGLDLSLQAKKRGWRVIYDPRALVYHHIAPRAPELDRQERGRRLFCYCRNYTYIILKRLPFWRRLVFLGWWFLIGERDGWGIGALAFDKVSGEWRKNRYVAQAWQGKIEGIRLWLKE